MDKNSVEVEVQYDSHDLWLSYLISYFTFSTVWYFFLSFAVYGLVLAFIFLKGDPRFLQILGTLVTAFVFVILLGLINSYFSATSGSAKRKPPVKFVFESDRINMSNDKIESRIEWSFFVKATESSQRFCLYTDDKKQYWLPKKAFADGDIEKLRQLLLDHAEAMDVRLEGGAPGFEGMI